MLGFLRRARAPASPPNPRVTLDVGEKFLRVTIDLPDVGQLWASISGSRANAARTRRRL